MTAPCRLVWDAAGRPAITGPAAKHVTETAETCAVCGEHADRTAPVAKALGGNFNDHYLLAVRRSETVCVPCLWVLTGKPPDTIRMWSVVVAPNRELPPSHPKAFLQTPGLLLTNKADTSAIIDTLVDPPDGPWLVGIAVSAQKHVVPFATVNSGAGRWRVRFEASDVDATPDAFRDVLTAAATLRAAKHTAADVLDVRPTIAAVKTRDDLSWWQQHAAVLQPWRNSPLLDMTLWLLTKERINEHSNPRPDGPGDPVPGRPAQLRIC